MVAILRRPIRPVPYAPAPSRKRDISRRGADIFPSEPRHGPRWPAPGRNRRWYAPCLEEAHAPPRPPPTTPAGVRRRGGPACCLGRRLPWRRGRGGRNAGALAGRGAGTAHTGHDAGRGSCLRARAPTVAAKRARAGGRRCRRHAGATRAMASRVRRDRAGHRRDDQQQHRVVPGGGGGRPAANRRHADQEHRDVPPVDVHAGGGRWRRRRCSTSGGSPRRPPSPTSPTRQRNTGRTRSGCGSSWSSRTRSSVYGPRARCCVAPTRRSRAPAFIATWPPQR